MTRGNLTRRADEYETHQSDSRLVAPTNNFTGAVLERRRSYNHSFLLLKIPTSIDMIPIPHPAMKSQGI